MKKILLSIIKNLFRYDYAQVSSQRKINKFLSKNIAVKELALSIDGQSLKIPLPNNYVKYWYLSRCKNGKPHENNVLSHFIACLKESVCFADIGSHMGYYALIASLFLKDENIFSFEMNPHNFELQRGFFRDFFATQNSGIHLTNAAISNAKGSLEISKNQIGDAGFSIHKSDEECRKGKEEVSVPMIMLDDFFKDRDVSPDILKIDVEGAESDVLHGMVRLLEKPAIKIFLEIHQELLPNYGAKTEQVINFLKTKGFRIFHIPDLRDRHENEIADKNRTLREVHNINSLGENEMLFLKK